MNKLQNAIKNQLCAHMAEFYEEGVCKLVKLYDKFLNLNGDYVGK
jgi:hypothetical protein